MTQPASRCTTRIAVTALLAAVGSQANASSFALIEQSVSGMGTAYAIGSAGIGDASTLFFNPAGMSRLPGTNLSGGLQVVNSRVDINAEAEYSSNPALLPDPPVPGGLGIAGDPIDGTGSANTDLTAAIPSGYISHQVNDTLWAGLAITGHFGLKTDYNGDWVGRYHADNSELLTYDFNPSLAFKVNERTTLAIGASALYAEGELTNAIDGGLLDTLNGGSTFVDGVTFPPGGLDLNTKLTGDDWGFGFNVGLLFEPTDNTRIGMHYRSSIDLDVEGDNKLSHPTFGVIRTQDAKLPLTLPASFSLSGYHALNSRWAVMADWTRMQWSEVRHVDITLTNTDNSIMMNNNFWDYDDSNRFAVGTEYRHNSNWTFRSGVALDQTPVPNDSVRSPRVPDADRTWLTLGASYRYSPEVTLDFGYAHLFVDDPELDNVSDANDPASFGPVVGATGFHSLSGDYDAAVDIVGVQVNWKVK